MEKKSQHPYKTSLNKVSVYADVEKIATDSDDIIVCKPSNWLFSVEKMWCGS